MSHFNNHGAGFPSDGSNNNAHLGASTGREGDTLSAGSTANGSFSRMAHNNELEKDFSQQNGKQIVVTLTHWTDIDSIRLPPAS
jgi:hypothetical protein